MSLFARLLSIFPCPGDVFEEVAASAPRWANWLVPTLLVAVTSTFLAVASANRPPPPSPSPNALPSDQAAATQPASIPPNWEQVATRVVWLGAFAGPLWSALLLWLIGRFLLRTRFSYFKAVEVASLAGMIVALGAIVNVLLIAASNNPAARPALSLFAKGLPAHSAVRLILDGLNVFHLWATALLALGLSKLAGVSLKESGFWVFGYWLVARLASVILAG